jgi:CRISPR/Cas system-associated exonuclease Cas4 (RecB family)
MKYDKINGKVGFLEEPHVYKNIDDPTINYVSVTTLISKFEQPYDKDFWSAYKALEKLIPINEWKPLKDSLLNTKKFDKECLSDYNISENEFNKVQQDILDEWQKKNKESCDRGTKIHAQLENALYNKDSINLQKYGIGGKFICKKDYTDLNLEHGVYPEYLVYYDHPKLHIAGQIDLLIKSGNDIIIGDYKTNAELKFKSFYSRKTKKSVKMKYPLTKLDDVNFNHYQLQLSTYAWMLQKLNPEFNIKRLFIVHFPHEGGSKIYEVEYLKDDVEKMLKAYIKQTELDKQKKKYERI